jgi:hypothetical protein
VLGVVELVQNIEDAEDPVEELEAATNTGSTQ